MVMLQKILIRQPEAVRYAVPLSTCDVLLPVPNPAANGERVATLMRQLRECPNHCNTTQE